MTNYSNIFGPGINVDTAALVGGVGTSGFGPFVSATYTFVVPSDWSDDNQIHVIGAGQAGERGGRGVWIDQFTIDPNGHGGAGGDGAYWCGYKNLKGLTPGSELRVTIGGATTASSLLNTRTPGEDTVVRTASGIMILRAPGGGSSSSPVGPYQNAGGAGSVIYNFTQSIGAFSPLPLPGGRGGGGAGGPFGVGGRGGWAGSGLYAAAYQPITNWSALTFPANGPFSALCRFLILGSRPCGGGAGNGGYDAGGVIPYTVDEAQNPNVNPNPPVGQSSGGTPNGLGGGPGGSGDNGSSGNGGASAFWFNNDVFVRAGGPGGGGAGKNLVGDPDGKTDFEIVFGLGAFPASTDPSYGQIPSNGGRGGQFGGGGGGGQVTDSAGTPNSMGGDGGPGLFVVMYTPGVPPRRRSRIVTDIPSPHYLFGPRGDWIS